MSSDHTAYAGRREWLGLVVLALPTAIIALDFTALHLAAPAIARDLDPSPTQLLWIVDVYGFLIAGLLLTMGTLGDRTGRRRLLLVGAGCFAVVSAVAAFAPTPELLIAARALLGVAGATLMPSTLSLIRTMFEDRAQRTTAIAVWMGALTVGSALGPLVGGLLLERFWWGSVFLIGIPVMLLLLVTGPFLLPEHVAVDPDRIDPASVVLSLGAILPLVWGVKQAAAEGPDPTSVTALAAGLVVGVVFVRRQRQLRTPVLDVALFAEGGFSRSVAVHLGTLLLLAGVQYLLLQQLQVQRGLSALHAGLWTLPATALAMVGAVVAPWAVRRVEPTTVIPAGLVVAVVGLVVVALGAGASGLGVLITGFALLSFAVSLVTALTTDRIVGAAPPERAGNASGISETAAELGLALGVALLGSLSAVLSRSAGGDLAAGLRGASLAGVVIGVGLLALALRTASSAAGSPSSGPRRASRVP